MQGLQFLSAVHRRSGGSACTCADYGTGSSPGNRTDRAAYGTPLQPASRAAFTRYLGILINRDARNQNIRAFCGSDAARCVAITFPSCTRS